MEDNMSNQNISRDVARSMGAEYAKAMYADRSFQKATNAIIGSLSHGLALLDPHHDFGLFADDFMEALRYERAQWTACYEATNQAGENVCEQYCGGQYITPAGDCICVKCVEIRAVIHEAQHDL
jgi:hypothetical protein